MYMYKINKHIILQPITIILQPILTSHYNQCNNNNASFKLHTLTNRVQILLNKVTFTHFKLLKDYSLFRITFNLQQNNKRKRLL